MKAEETVVKIRRIFGFGDEFITKINIKLEEEIKDEVVHDLIVDWCYIVDEKEDGTFDIFNFWKIKEMVNNLWKYTL